MTGRHHPSRPQLTGDALAREVVHTSNRVALAVDLAAHCARVGEAMRTISWAPTFHTTETIITACPDDSVPCPNGCGASLRLNSGAWGHRRLHGGVVMVHTDEPIRVTCPDCQGYGGYRFTPGGHYIDGACDTCNGTGTLPGHIAETDCTVGPDTDTDADDLPPEPDAVEVESTAGIREQAYRAGALAALDELTGERFKAWSWPGSVRQLRADIAARRWPAPGEVPA